MFRLPKLYALPGMARLFLLWLGVTGFFASIAWWDYPLDGLAAFFLRTDLLGSPINEYYFFLDPWTFFLTPLYILAPAVPWYGMLIAGYYALALYETWRLVPVNNRFWLIATLPIVLDNLLWPSFTRVAAWVGGLGALHLANNHFQLDRKGAMLLLLGLALRQDIVLFVSAVIFFLQLLSNPSKRIVGRFIQVGIGIVLVVVGYHLLLLGPQRLAQQTVVIRHFFTSDMGLWRQLTPDATAEDSIKLKALQFEFNVDRQALDDDYLQQVQAGTIFMPPLLSELNLFKEKLNRTLFNIRHDRLFAWVTFLCILITVWIGSGFQWHTLGLLLFLPGVLIGIQVLVKPENRAEGPLTLVFSLLALSRSLPQCSKDWVFRIIAVGISMTGLTLLLITTQPRYRQAESNYQTRKRVWQLLDSHFSQRDILLEVGGMLLTDLKPFYEPSNVGKNRYLVYEMYFSNDPDYHRYLINLTGEDNLLSVWKFMAKTPERLILSDPQRMNLKQEYFRKVYQYELKWETLPESRFIDILPHTPVANLNLYRITRFSPISVDEPKRP